MVPGIHLSLHLRTDEAPHRRAFLEPKVIDAQPSCTSRQLMRLGVRSRRPFSSHQGQGQARSRLPSFTYPARRFCKGDKICITRTEKVDRKVELKEIPLPKATYRRNRRRLGVSFWKSVEEVSYISSFWKPALHQYYCSGLSVCRSPYAPRQETQLATAYEKVSGFIGVV
ncbi:hypothetical protein B0H12DRAFT_1282857 [Mycena haematopus]|nr:hypothetical protein B0H12DRAFT_1282857 [Mycena haematopus]